MPNNKVYNPNVEQITGENIELPKSSAPVVKVPKPNLKGEAELPVVNPGAGALPASTSSVTPTAKPTTNDTAPTTTGYTSNNETAWADGYASYAPYVDSLKGQVNASNTTALSKSEYDALLKQYGITQESAAGIDKTVYGGTSGADETLLSDTGYALIQSLKAEYANLQQLAQQAEAAGRHDEAAQYRAQMKSVNDTANRVRAGAGYYGGTDGSMYVTLGELGVSGTNTSDMGGTQNPSTGGSNTSSTESQLRSYLEQWKAAAEQQANGQIDYAVEQAIKELERALEDAQPQFKEQAESVALAERQALDNSALYAELRGDKGGIGQEQYNSIQNTAAQNHLAVQQAQTKLSTDTARQIADLRAQGEFEKADKALEITQQYLAQLISLEQWAAEYNLSVEQFQASLKQWESEYEMALQQMEISKNQWADEFKFQQEQAGISNNQWQQQFDYNALMDSKSQQAAMGEALLSAGIMPDANQLAAMGLTAAKAQEFITALQLEKQLKEESEASENPSYMTDDEVYWYLYSNGVGKRDSAEAELMLNKLVRDGKINSKDVDAYLGAYGNSGYQWAVDAENAFNDPATYYDMDSLRSLGLAGLSVSELEELTKRKIVSADTKNGKIVLKWAPGWSLQQYLTGHPAVSVGSGGHGGMTLGDPIKGTTYDFQ